MHLKTISISNDRLVHITLIISIILIVGIVTYSYSIPIAEAAYCGPTCRAKQAAKQEIEDREEAIENRKLENATEAVKEKEDKKEQKCYGIYCDDIQEEELTQVTKDFIAELGKKNFISIRLSTSCKQDMPTIYCPSVIDLANTWDNSNRYLSGDFYFDNATGQWKRTPPIVPNIFETYKFNKMSWVLWVEPDHYTWINSKQITIHPSLTYIDRKDIIEDRTRIEYVGLKFERCATAQIGWANNGSAILLDVLNHYMSNCVEKVQYDPRQEIFINSTIFADCDLFCLKQLELTKLELKAQYQTDLLFEDHYVDNEDDDNDRQTCFGLYCDDDDDDDVEIPDDRPQTIKEKIEERQIKKIKYEERLRELEDIQECEKYKRQEPNVRTSKLIDCNDEDERVEYLLDKRKEANVEETEEQKETRERIEKDNDDDDDKCYGIHCD